MKNTLVDWCFRDDLQNYCAHNAPGAMLVGYLDSTRTQPTRRRRALIPKKYDPSRKVFTTVTGTHRLANPDPLWTAHVGEDGVRSTFQWLETLPLPNDYRPGNVVKAKTPKYPSSMREELPEQEMMYTLDISADMGTGVVRHVIFAQSTLNSRELHVLMTAWHAIIESRARRRGNTIGDEPLAPDAFPPLRCRDVYDMLGSSIANTMGIPDSQQLFFDWCGDIHTVQRIGEIQEIPLQQK